jgi:hypothetical protein
LKQINYTRTKEDSVKRERQSSTRAGGRGSVGIHRLGSTLSDTLFPKKQPASEKIEAMWRRRGLLGLDELRERRPRSIENLLLLPLGLFDLVQVLVVDRDRGAGNEAGTGLREPALKGGGGGKALDLYFDCGLPSGLHSREELHRKGGLCAVMLANRYIVTLLHSGLLRSRPVCRVVKSGMVKATASSDAKARS